MPERTPSFITRKRVQIAAAIVGAPAALGLVSCGGGSESGKTFVSSDLTQTAQAGKPTQEGTKVIVVGVTATPVPTNTPEPIPTPTPEKILTLPEVSAKVNTAVADLPDRLAVEIIRGNLVLAERAVAQDDPMSTNSFVPIGRELATQACKFSENQSLAEAFIAVRAYALSLVKLYEGKGILAKGVSLNWAQNNMPIPLNCPNRFLAQPK